ncbi:ubiquitin thioesterase [Anaeramoeba ignava]|uniref:ubiquitinyl hydrolase 1 n=1 Tax=Anaeramoeba ignava TaxID=1746090 RepID=A0A9Q0LKP8_ANAIG|nr:ubiquitin thioesterase [Anaeramoeba ignava]
MEPVNPMLIFKQMDEIKDEIKSKQPLVGSIENLINISQEYKETNPIFEKRIIELSKEFPKVQRMRADGNCFYRGFFYALFLFLIQSNDKDSLTYFQKKFAFFRTKLEKRYGEFIMEMFCDSIDDVLLSIEQKTLDEEKLLDLFNEQMTSESIVAYARFLTSTYISENQSTFSFYVPMGMTVSEYCKQNIEPMEQEADHPEIFSLSSALLDESTGLAIQKIDGKVNENYQTLIFPNQDSNPKFNLLYRPGHYDILFK